MDELWSPPLIQENTATLLAKPGTVLLGAPVGYVGHARFGVHTGADLAQLK